MSKMKTIQLGFYSNTCHVAAEKVKMGSEVCNEHFEKIVQFEQRKGDWTENVIGIPYTVFEEMHKSLSNFDKKNVRSGAIILLVDHKPIGILHQAKLIHYHLHNCKPDNPQHAICPETNIDKNTVKELFCPACGVHKPVEEFKTLSI